MLKTEVESLEQSRVRLKVTVPPEEFEEAISRAARHLGSQVKLKGFRKGRVPRQVLEAYIGREAITEHAVEESLEGYLHEAIVRENLDVVGSPEVENVDTSDGGLRFEATLTVLPKPQVEGWRGITLDIPRVEVTEKEVDEQIESFRLKVAPLESVSRPAKEGDFVLIDLRGEVHGKEVPGLALSDFSYEVGSKSLLPKLDETLEGKRPGDILKFNDELPDTPARLEGGASEEGTEGKEGKEGAPRDARRRRRPGSRAAGKGPGEKQEATERSEASREATFTVIVKEVRERRPEPLTDAWVEDNTEWDSVEEMRQGVRQKLAELKRAEARKVARDKALEKIAELVHVEVPEEAIRRETQRYAEELQEALAALGISIDQYLRDTGRQRADLELEWRRRAQLRIKADMALESIARQEGIEASPEEVERQADAIVARTGSRQARTSSRQRNGRSKSSEEELRRLKDELTKGRASASVAAGIINAKALQRVLDEAVLAPEGGGELRWNDLEPDAPESRQEERLPEENQRGDRVAEAGQRGDRLPGDRLPEESQPGEDQPEEREQAADASDKSLDVASERLQSGEQPTTAQ